jgi:hypothetical protein
MSGGGLTLDAAVMSSPFRADPLARAPVAFSGAMTLLRSQAVSNGGVWMFGGPVTVSFGGYFSATTAGAIYAETPSGGMFSLSLIDITPGPLASSSGWTMAVIGLAGLAGLNLELSTPVALGASIDSGKFNGVSVTGVGHIVVPEPAQTMLLGAILIAGGFVVRRYRKEGRL